ncbi:MULTISPECIES: hypothetical protein [unclassified Streptomyces]|uniref:hypothetical protein n=1 Tax=unclassified Streptomyces TaxID=2593676 RepID=UPI0011E663D3|nr:hypothetical protein [Streptomyces sp. sk2.1]
MKKILGLAASAVLVAGGVGLTATTASAAPTAACSLSPAGIGQFTLDGSGFLANSPVNILKNGALQAVTTTNAAGSFTIGAVRGNFTAVSGGASTACGDPFITEEESKTEIGQSFAQGFADGQIAGKAAAQSTNCGTPQIRQSLRQDAYADGYRDGFTRAFDAACAPGQGQGQGGQNR